MRYLLFILAIVITQPAFSQYSAQEILTLASKSMAIRKSVNYYTDCEFKFFDSDDTIRFSGEVQLMKEARDSIFGGYISYTMLDTLHKLYDLNSIYIVNTQSKKTTVFDPHVKKESWVMTGNTHHHRVWEYFLEPDKLYRQAHGISTPVLQPDTIVAGRDCYRVMLDYPDDEEYTDHKITICVTKDDKVPILNYRKIKYQGNYQYSSFRVGKYKFNTLNPTDFTIDDAHKKFPVDTFKMPEQPELLAKGTDAPAIKGQHYQQDLSEAEVDFKGKVTLLDFWYMSCYPCIQAIPTIEKLYEAYKDKGLQVFGVNPYDMKRIEKMPQFLEHNPIKYPIYMVDIEIPTSYNVRGYPTFYIIDRMGKVHSSSVGYGPEAEKELTKAIEEVL